MVLLGTIIGSMPVIDATYFPYRVVHRTLQNMSRTGRNAGYDSFRQINLNEARGRRSELSQFSLRFKIRALTFASLMLAFEPLISRSAGVHRRNSYRNRNPSCEIRSVLSSRSVELYGMALGMA
jgi:hypothetical protein